MCSVKNISTLQLNSLFTVFLIFCLQSVSSKENILKNAGPLATLDLIRSLIKNVKIIFGLVIQGAI